MCLVPILSDWLQAELDGAETMPAMDVSPGEPVPGEGGVEPDLLAHDIVDKDECIEELRSTIRVRLRAGIHDCPWASWLARLRGPLVLHQTQLGALLTAGHEAPPHPGSGGDAHLSREGTPLRGGRGTQARG